MQLIIKFILTHRRVLLLALIIFVVALVVRQHITDEVNSGDAVESTPPVVELATPLSLTSDATTTIIGTVVSTNEAFITSQTGGQIRHVHVQENQTVQAGAVLVTLENSQQRAAVQQAEAALATAMANISQSESQNTIGRTEASVALQQVSADAGTTIADSFNTADRMFISSIDPLFSNPKSRTPGARVGSGSLVPDRVRFQTIMADWETLATQGEQPSDRLQQLTTARDYVNQLLTFFDRLLLAVENESPSQLLSANDLQQLKTNLTQDRSQLLQIRRAMDGATTAIRNAQEAAARAELSTGDSATTLNNAQITQAQVALDTARTQLAQTVIRSPISGTLERFDVTLGDYVSPGRQLGTVVNTSGLQIEAFITASDRRAIRIGDTVTLPQQGSGVVTDIAQSADPNTRKIKMTVGVTEGSYTINDSVRISFTQQRNMDDRTIMVPITAVQFTGANGNVLTVNDSNELIALPVTLGETRNTMVEILDGIENTTAILIDARGRRIETVVTPVINE